MPDPDRTESVVPDSSGTATVRILDSGTRIGDRYEVQEVLGFGGYAVVYLARDRELRRDIALKVLRADRMSPASLQRFRREAAVARDASSPRLVRVFDIGTSSQAVYLTMERVEGESLRERLQGGPLPVDEALRIAVQVLEGLQVLHSLSIIHRDIKPGNILLTPEGEVKLADFGLALSWGSDETRVTVGEGVLGTIAYISPEQALGQEVDPRSDLYSLGVVLFEMLTGRLPYQESSSLGTLLGRLRKPAPNVRDLRPEVPAWLAAAVAGLLEKDRARRYPDVAAVLADLREKHLLRTRKGRGYLVRAARAAALGLALSGGVIAWNMFQRSNFSHLVALGETGVAAVDRQGKRLWEDPRFTLGDQFAVIHLPGTNRPHLAAILRSSTSFEPEKVNVLSLLDAETGTVVKEVRLPSAAASFPEFSNQFGPVLRAIDLDGDRREEVLVSYIHNPFWPSYTVLYEPRIDRARLLFIGSGHHRVAGAEDLDGDGRAEIILSGINNRMGWFSAIAAVRIVPPVNQTVPGQDHTEVAWSPDEPYSPGRGALLWYALAQRASPDPPGRMRVDPVNRALFVYYRGAQEFEISYDGFAHPAKLSAAARQASRWQAYKHLREATRLLRSGLPGEALPESEAASKAAERAADLYLTEWVSRVRGRILIAVGQFQEAEILFRTLSGKSESASDIAYDAGRAFHLAGQLERALVWYRRGLARGGTPEAGRGKYELLEGIVLILGEQARWEDGVAEVARFQTTYGFNQDWWMYREYLRWRAGETPSLDGFNLASRLVDLHRYWLLEFRLFHRQPLNPLLSDLQTAKQQSSETRSLLQSLEGEILSRLGRSYEALAAARQAYRGTRLAISSDPIAQAHFDLVAERFARLARQVGRDEEADEALTEVRTFRRQRREGDVPSRDPL